jgi:hypothetical protein
MKEPRKEVVNPSESFQPIFTFRFEHKIKCCAQNRPKLLQELSQTFKLQVQILQKLHEDRQNQRQHFAASLVTVSRQTEIQVSGEFVKSYSCNHFADSSAVSSALTFQPDFVE